MSVRILLVGLLALLTGCVKSTAPEQIFRMGERVQAGSLVYNVFEADWTPKIGSGDDAKTPTHRFLVVHLSVTNGAADAVSMPSLNLVDEKGESFSEAVTEAAVPAQLGLIRTIKPAETLHGRILFDVEPKSYKLKLDDGLGKTAMVEMPLRFNAEQTNVLGGVSAH